MPPLSGRDSRHQLTISGGRLSTFYLPNSLALPVTKYHSATMGAAYAKGAYAKGADRVR